MMMTVDRLIARVPLPLRYMLAALVLCGLIFAMVMQRAAILRDGRDVRLQVVPVDPRDLFRGDYVVLNYRIGTVEAPADARGGYRRAQRVFVTLRPDGEGRAQAVGVSLSRPSVSGQDVVIAGKVVSNFACPFDENGQRACVPGGNTAVMIHYGLESYFVPQGEGRAIERTEKSRIEVVAAVAPSGQAAIKHLLIDGKPVYTEPPY